MLNLSNDKESTASCPITKASNNSNFYSSRMFRSLFSQPVSVILLSLFVTFLILEIKKISVQRRVTIPQLQHHVSSAQQSSPLIGGVRSWMGDHIRIPRVVITSFFSFFFLFFPQSFPKAMLKIAELSAFCNVISSVYELFVPHFAMSVFMCTISYK